MRILCGASPVTIGGDGAAVEVTFASGDRSDRFSLAADQVLTAIGQTLAPVPAALATEGGKIAITGPGRTSLKGVWAGGDCAAGGNDLTVTAVAEGRDAAMDIHATLLGA